MMTSAGMGQGGLSHNATRAFLKVIARRKLLLIAPLVLALGSGWVLLETLPRRYAAEAVLTVDARKVRIVENEVVSRLPQESAALRTELDIITSRSLAEQVVDRLGLAADPDTLREVGADRTIPGLLGQAARQAADRVLESAARLRWIGIPAVPNRLAQEEPPQPSRADVVGWLLAHLKASNDNRSFTIFVTFSSENPERAARLANAIAQGYLNDQVELKATTTRSASRWLAEKLSEMRQAVAVADAAVVEFRRTSGLIETRGATVTGQQLSEMNTQLALARAERARSEGRLQMARTSNGSALPEVLAAPTIQELRTQLSRAEVHLAENAKNLYMVPDLQVSVRSLKKQIDAETERIVASISGEVEAARVREATLAASMQRLQTEYGDAFVGTVKLNQLQREADANRTIYEAFLTRYKETINQESLATPDARLIAEAQVPTIPVFPKRLPILLISCLFGILIGGVLAAVRERLDDRVREVGQLDSATGIPVFGTVPKVRLLGWPGRRYGLSRGRSTPLGVALQWLQATLQRPSGSKRMQVTLVTSAMAAEGKTTLCVCLARELARTGLRVLVIDADPYRARLASAFGGSARRNLGLLAAGSSRIDEVAQIDGWSGAHFVAAASPEEFQHLTRSAAFAQIIEKARKDYDMIILDAAPVLAGADAALIGRLADVRLFVVRYGRTPWDRLMSALTALRLCGSVVDGIVVTGVDRRDRYYSGSRFGNAPLPARPPLELSA